MRTWKSSEEAMRCGGGGGGGGDGSLISKVKKGRKERRKEGRKEGEVRAVNCPANCPAPAHLKVDSQPRRSCG
jgi:hypothetical protein